MRIIRLCIIGLMYSGIAIAVETVELEVAQSYVFSTPENSTLKISRKGVVDVYENSPGQWSITALRKGLISISWMNSHEDILGRIYVNVSSFGKENMEEFPLWICKRQGVNCDVQAGIVAGKTGDELVWLRAFRECERMTNCFFKLELTKEAGRRLEESTVLTDERYMARATVVLADRKEAEKLGITMDYLKDSAKVFDFNLNDQVEKNNLTLLGEPAVLCQIGEEAIIRSGGEVESFYKDPKSSEHSLSYWKKYGLMLKIKLARSTPEVLNGKMKLELSRKNKGGLQSHELETSVPIHIGKTIMLGVVEFQSDETSSLVPFHLGSIPIIGPWFTFRTVARVFNLMLVFLTVNRWSELQFEGQK